MSGSSHTTTNNRRLLRPSEIKKSNLMVENIMEVLENTFLSSFHDELDAAKLYNIVSGQPVDDSVKESLLSLEEAGKQLMSEYIERMSTETHSESTVMDKIKQYKMKNLTASNLSFKVKRNEKTTEIRLQRDILGKLVQSSYRNNAYVDVENLLKYPLAPVCLALGNSDRTIRKTCKSKLYDTAMSDLVTVDKTGLPGHDVMNTYFVDLAAVVRTKLKGCFTIRQLTWQIFHSVPDQFSIIYFFCDTYQQKSIKNPERLFHGSSQRYILKSPDMKLPADMQKFIRNDVNKKMFSIL